MKKRKFPKNIQEYVFNEILDHIDETENLKKELQHRNYLIEAMRAQYDIPTEIFDKHQIIECKGTNAECKAVCIYIPSMKMIDYSLHFFKCRDMKCIAHSTHIGNHTGLLFTQIKCDFVCDNCF